MSDFVFKYNTPVLIICFNRPQYVEKQIEALRVVKPPTIFISIDGARENVEKDKVKVNEVRQKYLNGIDWECKLKTRILDINLGCSKGPVSAMQWFFEHVEEGIIIEDDIIPGTDFFRFAQEMLNKYRPNKKIISISGCNLGYRGKAEEYFFSKIMNMWGWATWRDRFIEVDFNIEHWKKCKNKRLQILRLFYKDLIKGNINYLKKWYYIWNKTINTKELSWWDYQFIYNQLINKQLCVFPGRNLILNVGFTEEATHTKNLDHFMIDIEAEEIKFPLKHPIGIKNNRYFEQEFIIKKWFEQ